MSDPIVVRNLSVVAVPLRVRPASEKPPNRWIVDYDPAIEVGSVVRNAPPADIEPVNFCVTAVEPTESGKRLILTLADPTASN